MEIDYSILGERIRRERRKQGLTQEDLAYKIDMSSVFLSRVERGTSRINLNRLAQISNVLDIPLETLITGTCFKSEKYLDNELYEIITQCSPVKQKLIYNLAKIVLSSNFVKWIPLQKEKNVINYISKRKNKRW